MEVQPREHGIEGLSRFAIEAVERQAGAVVAVALPLNHVVLGVPPDPVLGAEHGAHIHAGSQEVIEVVHQVRGDGGLVRHQAHALATHGVKALVNPYIQARLRAHRA